MASGVDSTKYLPTLDEVLFGGWVCPSYLDELSGSIDDNMLPESESPLSESLSSAITLEKLRLIF